MTSPYRAPPRTPRSRTPQFVFVMDCQDRALDVRIANQGFLLSTGDTFIVPGGNEYSIANTSATATATCVWFLAKREAAPRARLRRGGAAAAAGDGGGRAGVFFDPNTSLVAEPGVGWTSDGDGESADGDE